jgi:hypothetical protein
MTVPELLLIIGLDRRHLAADRVSEQGKVDAWRLANTPSTGRLDFVLLRQLFPFVFDRGELW